MAFAPAPAIAKPKVPVASETEAATETDSIARRCPPWLVSALIDKAPVPALSMPVPLKPVIRAVVCASIVLPASATEIDTAIPALPPTEPAIAALPTPA